MQPILHADPLLQLIAPLQDQSPAQAMSQSPLPQVISPAQDAVLLQSTSQSPPPAQLTSPPHASLVMQVIEHSSAEQVTSSAQEPYPSQRRSQVELAVQEIPLLQLLVLRHLTMHFSPPQRRSSLQDS